VRRSAGGSERTRFGDASSIADPPRTRLAAAPVGKESFQVTQLIDRDREIGAIDALLAGARDHRGGALVLRGEAGIGLTSLLEYAAGSAAEMLVLRMAGVEDELRFPFGALQRLLTTEVDRLPGLPEPQRLALARAFGLESSPVETRLGPDPDWRVFLVGMGTLTLLIERAEEQPVLCAIDDVDALDDQSASALGLVARRLGAYPVAMLFAKQEPIDTPDRLAGIPELVVEPLEVADARTLVDATLGPQVDAVTRDRIVAETGGNPLAICELTTPRVALESAFAEPLPLTLPLERHLSRRLEQLSPAARDVLLLGALMTEGGPPLFWSALDLLHLDRGAVHEAVSGGTLVLGSRVMVSNSLLRSGAFALASTADRRRILEALAGAAEGVGDDIRAAWYVAGVAEGPDEATARALVAAAAKVRTAGDLASAALLLERASTLTPDASTSAARLLDAASARLAAGAPRRAGALLDEASALPVKPLDRVRSKMLRAQAALALGEDENATSLLLRAAQAVAEHDPELGRESILTALEAAVWHGSFGNGGQVMQASRTALALTDGDSESGPALLLHGLALLNVAGHEAAGPVLHRAIRSLQARTNLRWTPLSGLAALELWDDRELEVLGTTQGKLALAQRLTPTGLGLSHLVGLEHLIAGRLAQAADHYADLRTLSVAARDPSVALVADAGSLLVHAWYGKPDEARHLIERLMNSALAMNAGPLSALTQYALAILENGLGRYEDALAPAQSAVETRALYIASFALPEMVEAAVRSGETETAAEALGELERRTVPSGTSWAVGTLARSRALLAEADEAEDLYRLAIEQLRQSRAVPHLARAHLLYGEWLRRRRRRRDARVELRRAEAMFLGMGAEAFAARAGGELAANGGRPRPRGEPLNDALTPQEARISKLVVEGGSNPEIGAELFISRRTVEYHLHKIFRKLGVSSRVELAYRLRTEHDDVPPAG
jgi:DNA-binding CsgD family transcriptional regulator/tetratricopeptide (TPR) repeat protein